MLESPHARDAVLLDLAAESGCRAGELANAPPDREVLAPDVAVRDPGAVRATGPPLRQAAHRSHQGYDA